MLNPAQILQESRDTQRISDLSSVQSAIGLMLATASPLPTFITVPRCIGPAGCASGVPAVCGGFGTTGCVNNNVRLVNGTGWVGIDLTGTSGGPALSTLPQDPTNSTVYYYAYAGVDTSKTYELNARLESTKLRPNMQNDGGDDSTCTTFVEVTCWYEIGTDPGLDL